MATGTRLRSGTVYGTLSDALLTASGGATTMNSAGLGTTFMPAVSAPQYMAVILDPQQQNGAPEVVWITAHTGSTTTATVLRGQEGTSIRAHQSGEFWVAGPTPNDYFPWNWTSYTPMWNASSTAPSLGNGQLSGYYTLYGTTCTLSIYLGFGTTTSGGNGSWTFTLPPGVTSQNNQGQTVSCFAVTTGSGSFQWNGVGYIAGGNTSFQVFLPAAANSSNLGVAQNTDSSGATGHGIPNTGNNYPFINASFLAISGVFQTT